MRALAEARSKVVWTHPQWWKVRRLGSFSLKIGSGATPLGGKSAYLNKRISHALIRSQHVFDRHFDFANLAFISDSQAHQLRNAEVRSRDVLLNITGDGVTFGRACLVPNSVLPACVNQHVSIIRVDEKVCVPGYLLSFLTHPLAKEYIESFNTGGSRRAITKAHIESFEVPLPPLAVQSRIAEILSAYDELIENNQRRIRILDEMAHLFYREWFVYFRCPGYKKLPRIATALGEIPKGWEVKHIKDVANVTYGFPFQSRKFNATGIGTPVIRIRDILDGSMETSTDEEPGPKYHIKNGDILVGMDGDFHMCIWSSGHAFQNQRVAKFESRGEIGTYHLFLALELPIQTWNKSIVGTTVAHLGDMHIKTIQLAWPPAKVLARAQEVLEPMSEQIITLRRQTQNLRRARDLLLPRLLSGQVALDTTE